MDSSTTVLESRLGGCRNYEKIHYFYFILKSKGLTNQSGLIKKQKRKRKGRTKQSAEPQSRKRNDIMTARLIKHGIGDQ
jgi:hypothetical protein